MTDATVAFWSRVERRGSDDCWPWTGSKTGSGYGLLRGRRATHISLEIAGKCRPEGATLVRHHCDNPICVNPRHLAWGSPQQNAHDMVKRKRHHANRKTHCLRGHALSGENLIERKNGQRSCRTCQRVRDLAYRKTDAGRAAFNAARRKRRAIKEKQND